MTERYDNRKQKPNAAQQILDKYADKQTKKEEQIKKNEVEFEVSGNKYIIRKWKHLDTLARLPEFMNIWYGQVLANQTEQEARDELDLMDDMGGSGLYALQFLENLQNIDFENYVKTHLDHVFVKGSNKPIDLEDDVESPLDIWALFVKVSAVNFLMQLSQTICSTPSLIYLTETQDKQNSTNE